MLANVWQLIHSLYMNWIQIWRVWRNFSLRTTFRTILRSQVHKLSFSWVKTQHFFTLSGSGRWIIFIIFSKIELAIYCSYPLEFFGSFFFFNKTQTSSFHSPHVLKLIIKYWDPCFESSGLEYLYNHTLRSNIILSYKNILFWPRSDRFKYSNPGNILEIWCLRNNTQSQKYINII